MNFSQPLSTQQAVDHFNRYFQKNQAKNPGKPIQVKLYSQKLGLDYSFPPASVDQPYHIASIGKVFTATLVYMLAEKGLLVVNDLVSRYLSPPDLERLFVYQGSDYATQVTIEHLLGSYLRGCRLFRGGYFQRENIPGWNSVQSPGTLDPRKIARLYPGTPGGSGNPRKGFQLFGYRIYPARLDHRKGHR